MKPVYKVLFQKTWVLIFFLTGLSAGPDDDLVTVKKVTYIGLKSFHEKDLKTFVRNQPPKIFNKKEFDRRILKLDAISIKNFYVSKGFLEATVRDSFRVTGKTANVAFIISEGPRYYINRVSVSGNELISKKKIIDLLDISKQSPFNAISANRNTARVENAYFELGRLQVNVKLTPQISDSVDIAISILEGPEMYIKQIFIEGLDGLDSSVVQRELSFHPGESFNIRKVEKTQKRLLETGVFSSANISPVQVVTSDTLVNIIVELRQFSPREWKSAGGYYPIEYFDGSEPVPGIGGEVGWRNRRILNTSTNFSTQVTAEFPVDYQILYPKLKLNFDFTNKWFIGMRLPTRLNFYYETFKNYGLDEQFPIHRFGVEEINTFKFMEWSSMEFGLRAEKFIQPDQEIFDKDIEQRTAYYSLNILKADQPLNPHNGYKVEGLISQTGGVLGGTYNFYKGDLGISFFINPVWKIVFASRVKLGQIWGWSENKKDIRYDKFYLGGSTSMRGWKTLRFEETRNADNELIPAGGLSRFLVNLETRFPLFWIIGGEIFADGGVIGNSYENLTGKSIRWDAGAGLTLMTPLGPARLDYAIQLEGERNANIELGFQYSF